MPRSPQRISANSNAPLPLTRQRLLDRLEEALHRRLTILHAPAGYGKTTALEQWQAGLTARGIACVWVTLDAEPAQRDPLEAALSQAAAAGAPFVVIIDNGSWREHDAAAAMLRTFLRHGAPGARIVVASRRYPMLGQALLATSGQLLELDAMALRLDREEVGTLLAPSGQGKPDAELVRQVLARSEGWPVAVQLAALRLRQGHSPASVLAAIGGTARELGLYFLDEVQSRLPPDLQDVLLRAALAERLDAQTVNLLGEREDGGIILERLEEEGAFLFPVDERRAYYRLHPLFAEWLRERLARADAGLVRRLHEQLARRDIASGALTEGLRHARSTGHEALLAELLDAAGGWRLVPLGAVEILAECLPLLTEATIAHWPRLALARVYLLVKQGDIVSARTRYDQFRASDANEALSADMRTEAMLVGDMLAEYENQPWPLDELLARQAMLRSIPTSDHLMRSNICESLGAKFFEGGWLERALDPILEAQRHHRALGSTYGEMFTLFLEARIRLAQGQLIEAGNLLADAAKRIDEAFGPRSAIAANCAAYRAEVLFETNDVAGADALLQRAIAQMEAEDGWFDVYAAAYLVAARIAAERGTDEALGVLERAGRTATVRGLPQLSLVAQVGTVELMIDWGMDDDAFSLAEDVAIERHAATMGDESPVYRHVAIAATVCAAKLKLARGDVAGAERHLAVLRNWSRRHGAGRLAITLELLTAHACRLSGRAGDARKAFDDAVGGAMFQGFVRPFVEARRFIDLDALQDDAPEPDRYRKRFLRTLKNAIHRLGTRTPDRLLAPGEADILRLLEQGYTNKEIARIVAISPNTVKYRLKSIFRKLDVGKRRDAVRLSRQRGLATPAHK